MKPLNPDSLWQISHTLKKRIVQMIANGEINGDEKDKLNTLLKKPWNPYLLGRHSSLTEKTDMLNDFQLNQYARWGINSTRPRRTYVHRKGKQVINPLLEEYGIQEKPPTKTTQNTCGKCNHINTVESTVCARCSFVLNAKAWENVKDEEKKRN